MNKCPTPVLPPEEGEVVVFGFEILHCLIAPQASWLFKFFPRVPGVAQR